MFDFMYKFRMPILFAIVIGMSGFGVYGMFASEGGEIEDRELATFTVPSTDVTGSVRTPEYYQILRFLGLAQQIPTQFRMSYFDLYTFQVGLEYNERDPQPFVHGFVVLRDLARKSGLQVSPEGVEQLAQSLANAGVTRRGRIEGRTVPPSDELIAFARDMEMVRSFKAKLRDPSEADMAEVYEEYKKEFSLVKADYVLWNKKTQDDFRLDLTKPEEKAKLVEWWDDNPNFRRAMDFQIPEKVDLGVVYVQYYGTERTLEDLAAIDAKYATQFATITVDQAEIDRRYDAYASKGGVLPWSWILELEAEKRGELPEGQDQPDEKTVLRPHIERELKVAKMLGQVYAMAELNGLKAAAEAQGLEYLEVKGLTAEDLQSKHPNLAGGPRLWQLVRGQGIDKLGNETYTLGDLLAMETTTNDGSYYTEQPIYDEPARLMGLFSLLKHEKARDAELDEVLVKAYDRYLQVSVDRDFASRGTDFKKAVDDWIDANVEAVKTKKTELEAEAKENADKQIAEEGLDREKEEDKARIEVIEEQMQGQMRIQLAEARREHEAAGFRAAAAELGYEVKTFGPILAKSTSVPAYPEGISDEEKLTRYLTGQRVLGTLASLDTDRMTLAARSDFEANIGAHFLITERIEPTVGDMFARPDRYQPIVRRLQSAGGPFGGEPWTYDDMKQAHVFNLVAEDVEKAIEERAAEDARNAADTSTREERRQKRLERARAASRRASERAQSAGGSTPNPGTTNPGTVTPGDDTQGQ